MTGDEFRKAREELGLSQLDVASIARVSIQTVSSFEQGKRNTSAVVRHALLTALKKPKLTVLDLSEKIADNNHKQLQHDNK